MYLILIVAEKNRIYEKSESKNQEYHLKIKLIKIFKNKPFSFTPYVSLLIRFYSTSFLKCLSGIIQLIYS